MGDIICSTNKCKNKIDYFNSFEESYYCERCAHAMFNPKDCTKIGSSSVIKHMICLSENLLETIKNYAKEENLVLKWSQTLKQLKVFDDELIEIKEQLKNTLKDGKLKDLDKIEQRSFTLKFKITESESYRKYLFHKDMNEHRLRDEKYELKPTLAQVVRDMTHIRVEEQKTAMEERLQNWRNLYESKLPINQELEELKQKYSEEVEMIKKQQLEDKESYEKEKEEWLAQRIEIEQELSNFKNKLNDKKVEIPSISYDTFNSLYKEFIGQTVSLNSESSVNFCLNEEKWVKLLKALSNFRLPQLNQCCLYYVPENSEEVRQFMRNSSIHNYFLFNTTRQFQIEGSKYIEELKEVAKKTTDYFYVYNTNFSSKEFCELVSAAKNITHVYFSNDLIPLDGECDFGSDMDGCKIYQLYFNSSGNSNYSNWNQYPNRFENLIAVIAKCEPLVKSLKLLYIQNCGITKEKAQEMLDKYKLNGITLNI